LGQRPWTFDGGGLCGRVDDVAIGSRDSDGLEAGGGMGRPLHLQIGFDPAHQVLRAATSCGCAKSCLSPVGTTHSNSLGGAKSCLVRAGAMHGGSYGG
jgi:hypothetical protein